MTAADGVEVPDSREGRLARALLTPRSVALVGASDDPVKASSRPLAYLRRSGFDGEVYPVNPRRDTVAGEPAWRSLEALPEVPDHAFLMIPGPAVADAVRECGRLGVQVATILSDGFAEAGPEGEARQREIVRAAREGGVRLLGPNSLGLVNLRTGLRLTGNGVFAEPRLLAGGTFVASQSGSMIGSLVSRGQARGIGFSAVVSVGGEADLGIGEICAQTLDDPGTTGYLLFLETLRHADALADFARGAAERGKPVAAYKLGRSPIAAELALSHTGALAGEDDVATQFLAECGIARVDSLDGLLEAQPMLARLPIRRRGAGRSAVGVVTTTGGGAAMVVDQLGLRGVRVQRPSAGTYRRLAQAGVDVAEGHIVDVTLAGTRPEVMRAALEVLLSAPEFDAVVAVAGSSARLQPELAAAPILEVAGTDRPLAAFLVPEAPEALRRLTEAGVPAFRTPEACADVVAAALSRRPPAAAAPARGSVPGAGTVALDEAESYRVLADAGLPVAPHMVLPAEDTGGEAAGDTGEEARQALPTPPFGFPVAVKALDATLSHKSDAGGVVLGVRGPEELREAGRAIARDVARHGLGLRRLLVQPMVAGLGEVLIGYRVDPQVGPLVLLAAGGTLTELYKDRTVRLAPVDEAAAREMLDEVTALRALRGYRGGQRGDMDALCSAIAALSRLAGRPEVTEAEVNPLIVHPEGRGVCAVDALVRVAVPRDSGTQDNDREDAR